MLRADLKYHGVSSAERAAQKSSIRLVAAKRSRSCHAAARFLSTMGTSSRLNRWPAMAASRRAKSSSSPMNDARVSSPASPLDSTRAFSRSNSAIAAGSDLAASRMENSCIPIVFAKATLSEGIPPSPTVCPEKIGTSGCTKVSRQFTQPATASFVPLVGWSRGSFSRICGFVTKRNLLFKSRDRLKSRMRSAP